MNRPNQGSADLWRICKLFYSVFTTFIFFQGPRRISWYTAYIYKIHPGNFMIKSILIWNDWHKQSIKMNILGTHQSLDFRIIDRLSLSVWILMRLWLNLDWVHFSHFFDLRNHDFFQCASFTLTRYTGYFCVYSSDSVNVHSPDNWYKC